MSITVNVGNALRHTNMKRIIANSIISTTRLPNAPSQTDPDFTINNALIEFYDDIALILSFNEIKKVVNNVEFIAYKIVRGGTTADYRTLRKCAQGSLIITDDNHPLNAQSDSNGRITPTMGQIKCWEVIENIKSVVINILELKLASWLEEELDYPTLNLLDTLLKSLKGSANHPNPDGVDEFISITSFIWRLAVKSWNNWLGNGERKVTIHNTPSLEMYEGRDFGLQKVKVHYKINTFDIEWQGLGQWISKLQEGVNSAEIFDAYKTAILNPNKLIADISNNDKSSDSKQNDASQSHIIDIDQDSTGSPASSPNPQSVDIAAWQKELEELGGGDNNDNQPGSLTVLQRLNKKKQREDLEKKIKARRIKDLQANIDNAAQSHSQTLVHNVGDIEKEVRKAVLSQNKAALSPGLDFFHPGIEDKADQIHAEELVKKYSGGKVMEKDVQQYLMNNMFRYENYKKEMMDIKKETSGNITNTKKVAARIAFFDLVTEGGADTMNLLRYLALIGELNWSKSHFNIDACIKKFLSEDDAAHRFVRMIGDAINTLSDEHKKRGTTTKSIKISIYLYIQSLQWREFGRFIDNNLRLHLKGESGMKALNYLLLQRKKLYKIEGKQALDSINCRLFYNTWKMEVMAKEHENKKETREFDHALGSLKKLNPSSKAVKNTTNSTQSPSDNTYKPNRDSANFNRHSHQRQRNSYRGGFNRGSGRRLRYRNRWPQPRFNGYNRNNNGGNARNQYSNFYQRQQSAPYNTGNHQHSQYTNYQQQPPQISTPPNSNNAQFGRQIPQRRQGYRQDFRRAPAPQRGRPNNMNIPLGLRNRPTNAKKMAVYRTENGRLFGGPELINYICRHNERGNCYFVQDHSKCDFHHMCRHCYVINEHISEKCDNLDRGNVHGYGAR